jgi:hypothetical protein
VFFTDDDVPGDGNIACLMPDYPYLNSFPYLLRNMAQA